MTSAEIASGYNRAMPLRLFALITALAVSAVGQTKSGDDTAVPAAPVSQHRFWDRENILLFSGIAVFRGLDYASTRNFEARGRQEVLIPDDIVNNSAGFASLEAAGAATSVGISYILHRTGHHKMERWLSIGHISVTAFGVGWNYSLKTHRPH